MDEIWAIARRREALEALKAEAPVPVRPVVLDLLKSESFDELRSLLEGEQPEIALLVNAAGFGKFGAYHKTTMEDDCRMIDLNCKALLVMTRLQPDRKFLRRQVSKFGFALVEAELSLQEADMGSKGTGEDDGSSLFAEVRGILAELKAEDACLNLKDLAVNGNDLMALGFHGKEIGSCLNFLLEQVIEEQLPNEKTALLAFAAERREETQ